MFDGTSWNFNGHDMLFIDGEFLPEKKVEVSIEEQTDEYTTIKIT